MENYSIWLNDEEIASNLRSFKEAQELIEKYQKVSAAWGIYDLNFQIAETKI